MLGRDAVTERDLKFLWDNHDKRIWVLLYLFTHLRAPEGYPLNATVLL
jgi:hypothetical protein